METKFIYPNVRDVLNREIKRFKLFIESDKIYKAKKGFIFSSKEKVGDFEYMFWKPGNVYKIISDDKEILDIFKPICDKISRDTLNHFEFIFVLEEYVVL